MVKIIANELSVDSTPYQYCVIRHRSSQITYNHSLEIFSFSGNIHKNQFHIDKWRILCIMFQIYWLIAKNIKWLCQRRCYE